MKIVKQGQTFLDKVTQLTGSYENALEMAFLNGLSVTDDSSQDQRSMYKKVFVIGKEIKVSSITHKRVVSFFNSKNEPATAIIYAKKKTAPEEIGIGFMIIESNFKIG